MTTVLRPCHLCEAGCGLRFEVEGDRILSIRPDDDDPHSRGYVCPKGMALAEVHDDPDRLRRPVRRMPDGRFTEITWEEAFDLVGTRLRGIRGAHGADAVAVYFGNPLGHSYSAVLMLGSLVDAIGTRNRMSASSQDTAPRFAASYHLYGNTVVIPVPDLERTDCFLCIGANPVVSQGSAMVTPDVKARLRAIRARGGRIVTVDPRFTETARLADEHVFIKPGGDAAFLLAMLHVLAADGRIRRDAVDALSTGWPAVERRLRAFAPEQVHTVTGIAPETVRRVARMLAGATAPVVYTRIGTCNNVHGTLATWANDVLNLALGRLGAAGGWMFPEPALDAARVVSLGGMNGHGRWRTRVRGLPETQCDVPASTLAEEIETPGEGQIRALVTIAGNPVLSTPNGRRLDRALDRLGFMVSVDLYVNETTRHADVILPPCWALAEDHSEPIGPSVSLRKHVRWSPPVVPKQAGELADWEILLRLAEEMGGGPTGIRVLDAAFGVAKRLGWRFRPTALLDVLLRVGPHGDGYLPWSDGVTLAKVSASPYGVDLGPAREGVAHRVWHRDGKVHLDAGPILDDLDLLARRLQRPPAPGELLLVGRRELRSNN